MAATTGFGSADFVTLLKVGAGTMDDVLVLAFASGGISAFFVDVFPEPMT